MKLSSSSAASYVDAPGTVGSGPSLASSWFCTAKGCLVTHTLRTLRESDAWDGGCMHAQGGRVPGAPRATSRLTEQEDPRA